MNARAFASRTFAIALGALALGVAPVRAQQSAPSGDALAPAAVVVAPVAVAAPAPVAGPSHDAASVGVRRAAAQASAEAAAEQPAMSRSQSVKLMIVGGAAILTGIVVGNDAGYAISIGGAVIGLIGLYQFLQ